MGNLIPTTQCASTNNLSHFDIVNKAEQDVNILDVPISEFVKSSVKICALYGLNVPELPLMKELFDFVQGHFRWITIQHLELAFKLNASHQLDKKIEHFGAFSITFIGDVLTGYRPIRDRIYLEANKVQTIAIEMPKTDSKFSLQELIQGHKELIKKGKEQFIITGSWIIEEMEKEGMINADSFTEHDYKTAKYNAQKIVWSTRQLTKARIERMNDAKKKEFRQALISERFRQLYIIWLKK